MDLTNLVLLFFLVVFFLVVECFFVWLITACPTSIIPCNSPWIVAPAIELAIISVVVFPKCLSIEFPIFDPKYAEAALSTESSSVPPLEAVEPKAYTIFAMSTKFETIPVPKPPFTNPDANATIVSETNALPFMASPDCSESTHAPATANPALSIPFTSAAGAQKRPLSS